MTTPPNDCAPPDVGEATGASASGWSSALVALLVDGSAGADRLVSGARIDVVSAQADALRVVIGRDGASVAGWIRLRAAGGAAYRTTEHFLVGHEGHDLAAGALRLLDELHGEIVRRESRLSAEVVAAMRAQAVGRPDLSMPIEWLAVRAGAKPAARSVPSGVAVGDALVAAAERQGLCALAVEASDYLADFATGDAAGCRTIVYVGATPAAARAACDAEGAMIAAVRRGESVTPALNGALGRALGYPDCCIATFAPRCDLPNAALRFEALRATGASAFALLNDVDPRRAVISHFVCRYDCAASLRYARAVLDEVARSDATRASELCGALAGVVVLFRDGGAAILGDVHDVGDDRWSFRSTRVHGDASEPVRWATMLADADAIRIDRGVLFPFRDGRALAPLPFDEARVQVRRFVSAP